MLSVYNNKGGIENIIIKEHLVLFYPEYPIPQLLSGEQKNNT